MNNLGVQLGSQFFTKFHHTNGQEKKIAIYKKKKNLISIL